MAPFAIDTRATYQDVASVYAPIAAVVFVLVVGAIGFFVLRGLRREVPGGGKEERPLLEGAYIAVLAVVIAVLVAVTFAAQSKIDAAVAEPGLDVDVTAAKWNWRFAYPGTGIQSVGRPGAPAQLVVPAGREIRFRATSLDVLHGFWIPERRFQRTLIPHKTATFTMRFPAPAVIRNSACSFFCGLGHSDMRFEIRVLAPADFAAWLRRNRSRP